ncbi:programmed cell death protein 1 isoform X2 [Talpa occidentalis]|uniref:programmed cell death protein 1 isoform X2 n=1 Tax=Talpa occidentalis TaxID=50954 RepID=UPI0018908841|nr:programmed cell death protein 1 isoform X2 [Talpa occidentalis]
MGAPRALRPLVWAVLQLGWPPGWLLGTPEGPCSPPTFSPARLSVPEGGNASFTCSLPCTPQHPLLNWYRLGPGNRSTKLAAFPEDQSHPGRDWRFSVTQLPSGRDFHMSLVGAQASDSGVYICGAIYLPPRTRITESPAIELTVTERVPQLPTEHPSPTPKPAGLPQSLVVSVAVVLAAVLLLLLLLLAWGLAGAIPGGLRGKACGPPQKEDTPAVPVFTVDYGELDFEWREKTPEPPGPCVPEQTEYATIVFPGRPAPPCRRASADGRPGPRPLPPEDGHCSWPL